MSSRKVEAVIKECLPTSGRQEETFEFCEVTGGQSEATLNDGHSDAANWWKWRLLTGGYAVLCRNASMTTMLLAFGGHGFISGGQLTKLKVIW